METLDVGYIASMFTDAFSFVFIKRTFQFAGAVDDLPSTSTPVSHRYTWPLQQFATSNPTRRRFVAFGQDLLIEQSCWDVLKLA